MALWLLIFLGSHDVFAQQSNSVRWLTFEQLDDSLKVKPKKVFIHFYADWCASCRKMEKVAFQDTTVAAILNRDYYAVKMNVETHDTITFGDQIFVNERIKKRNPVHQIALLMASRSDKPFSLPALVLMNEKFEATARYFQYLNAEQMTGILQNE